MFKKVEEVYRRLGLSSALPDMPMESAVIVWKAWEEVGWDNLTPWQQIVVRPPPCRTLPSRRR